MKKLLLLPLLLGFSSYISGQGVSRVVLLEQFTQASCPPCQPENARIDPIVRDNVATVN